MVEGLASVGGCQLCLTRPAHPGDYYRDPTVGQALVQVAKLLAVHEMDRLLRHQAHDYRGRTAAVLVSAAGLGVPGSDVGSPGSLRARPYVGVCGRPQLLPALEGRGGPLL
ncbi:hypothetical protein [Nocardia asiatica]|uniref:hypothetical protein n=1 Tax=Nocardia asiatica TaxID=209252 RepID=UPI003EE0808B